MQGNQVSINRQIGSIFIVVGTEVGAGILALPILIAHLGFPLGALIMLVCWALLMYTSLALCEVNLSLDEGVSFAGMARNLLGVPGEMIVWISFLLLLYMIMVAYISAAGSAFSTVVSFSPHLVALIFVVVLGSCVALGTVAVDWVNRILLSTKLLLLVFVCILLLPNIHFEHLSVSFVNQTFILSAIPVFVTSFVSHLIIPSLRVYLKSNAQVMTRVFVIGSVIPLVLYLVWIMGVLGVVPFTGADSFETLFAKGIDANVGDVLNLMRANLHNESFYAPVAWFSNISVTTSFLGVSLALYHFLIDGFRLKKLPAGRRTIIAVVFTFAIPLVIVWFFPNVFIQALGYVGLCCAVLLIILPFFMIRKLKQRGHVFKIRYTDNRLLLSLSLLLGVVVVLIQLHF